MSYEKIKSIAIKGNVATITATSNNVYPHNYDKYTITRETREDLIKTIMGYIIDGEFHLQVSQANAKWLFAYEYACRQYDLKYLNDKVWSFEEEKLSKEESEKTRAYILDRLYYTYEGAKEEKGHFKVQLENGWYFKNGNRYRYRYCYYKSQGKTFKSKLQALAVCLMLNGELIREVA